MERRLFAWHFSRIVVLLGLCLCLLGPSYCAADVIEGQAAILNGNLDAARQQAHEDAMRAYVEQKVGVHIQGTTEVDMGMVVIEGDVFAVDNRALSRSGSRAASTTSRWI